MMYKLRDESKWILLRCGMLNFLLPAFLSSALSAPQLGERDFRVDARPAKVGNAYFSLLAEAMRNVGEIRGAVYDPESDGIVLVGDKNAKVPPLQPEDIAMAIQTTFSEKPEEPAASIDPDSKNPLGPKMHVVYFGGTANTHFGWVMFEADRVMKAYSLGKDNVTKDTVVSAVPGYYNILQLKQSNLASKHDPNLWNRFWLYPRAVVAQVSADQNSIYFEQTLIGVRTETMRWQGGKLVSAGGIIDSTAEYFARHFTKYYDRFADEKHVFGELKRLAQLLSIAKWMKARAYPIDWSWIEQYAQKNFKTDLITPSLTVQAKRRLGLRIEILQLFGGTDLKVEPQFIDDKGKAAELQKRVQDWLQRKKSQPAFDFPFDGENSRGVTLPGRKTAATGSRTLVATDAKIQVAPDFELELARWYNGSHQDVTDFGRGWSFNLPRLYSHNPHPKGKMEMTGIEGRRGTEVKILNYYLSDPFGYANEVFRNHAIDHELGRIVFAPESVGRFEGLYPQPDGAVTMHLRNRRKWRFSKKGRLEEEMTPNGSIKYVYDHRDQIEQIVGVSEAGKKITIRFARGAHGFIESLKSDDGYEVKYYYNREGQLEKAVAEGKEDVYRYLNGEITQVTRNGKDFYAPRIAEEPGRSSGEEKSRGAESNEFDNAIFAMKGRKPSPPEEIFKKGGAYTRPDGIKYGVDKNGTYIVEIYADASEVSWIRQFRLKADGTPDFEHPNTKKVAGINPGASHPFTLTDYRGNQVHLSLDKNGRELSFSDHDQLEKFMSGNYSNIMGDLLSKDGVNLARAFEATTDDFKFLRIIDLEKSGLGIFYDRQIFLFDKNERDFRQQLMRASKSPNFSDEGFLRDLLAPSISPKDKNLVIFSTDRRRDGLLSAYLRHKTDSRVFIDDDPKRARRNWSLFNDGLKERSIGLILDFKSFNATQKAIAQSIRKLFLDGKIGTVTTSIEHVPPESRFLIITAENDQQLQQRLLEVGPRMKGKFVMLFTCGDAENPETLTSAAQRIIREHGGIGVTAFDHRIDMRAVEVVLREMSGILSARPEAIDALLDRAIESAIEKNKGNQELHEELTRLRNLWIQISMLPVRLSAEEVFG